MQEISEKGNEKFFTVNRIFMKRIAFYTFTTHFILEKKIQLLKECVAYQPLQINPDFP